MVIGIIGAMDIEIKNIKNRLEDIVVEKIAGMNFYKGKIKGKNIVICNSLEGKVNSAVGTQILISKFNVDSVINIGVAGAVKNNELGVSDLVIANSTIEFDLDTTALGYDLGYVFGLSTVYMPCDLKVSDRLFEISKKYGNAKIGKIATSDKFVTDINITSMLKEKFDADAVDMETASICHVCNLNNVSFSAVRAISDSCNNIEYKDFLEIATYKLDKVIYDFINDEK